MTTKLTSQDNDVQVTYEDQQKINLFARTNARLQDAKEELDNKKVQRSQTLNDEGSYLKQMKDVQNLEDAETDLLMLEEEDSVPNQIGEVFVHLSHAETMDRLAAAKSTLQTEMAELEKRCTEHRKTLSDLKVHLYAKFGNNINLEAEDD